MLCRFRDQTALAGWEASPERQGWLRSAQGLAEVTRTERRTGIEGWFDEPVAGEVVTPSTAAQRPAALEAGDDDLAGVLPAQPADDGDAGGAVRTAAGRRPGGADDALLTPVMTYLVLPWVTARLDWWLHGRSWRDRGPG